MKAMHKQPAHAGHRNDERGIASVLLLFALSAFSVLGVAGLTTALGTAPEGQTFNIFRSIPQDALTRFAADMEVPSAWRAGGAGGSFRFQLPVLVPEMAGEERGASSAWHAMTEVPGLSVCCESQAGVCRQRTVGGGEPVIADWTPGTDDVLWMSFELASRRDTSATDNGDTVTATVSQEAAGQAPAGSSAVACQLEFKGMVIAKGAAQLAQVAKADGSGLGTAGTMRLAVRTK